MPRELQVHSVQTRSEKLRTWVEVVAIVAAGIWALYTFVYEQRIKPLGEAPSFSVPTTVDQGPTVNGVVFLTVRKTIQNTGNVPLDLAAEAISVYGERLSSRTTASHSKVGAQAEISNDVARTPVALIYSRVKLRSAAAGGNATDFVVPPHSSGEEAYLIAVPARAYPVIMVMRKDYIFRPPQSEKLQVRIVKALLGAYDLQSSVPPGAYEEYDSSYEFPIRP